MPLVILMMYNALGNQDDWVLPESGRPCAVACPYGLKTPAQFTGGQLGICAVACPYGPKTPARLIFGAA